MIPSVIAETEVSVLRPRQDLGPYAFSEVLKRKAAQLDMAWCGLN